MRPRPASPAPAAHTRRLLSSVVAALAMTTPVVAQTRAEVTPVGRDAPSDPRILIASALLLSTVGMVAAWVPAQRAARLEPRVAMQDGH